MPEGKKYSLIKKLVTASQKPKIIKGDVFEDPMISKALLENIKRRGLSVEEAQRLMLEDKNIKIGGKKTSPKTSSKKASPKTSSKKASPKTSSKKKTM